MSRKYKLKTYLTIEDVDKLIQATTNLRDRIIIRLLFYTGCKVSELLNIKIADIDFNQGYIVIDYLNRLERRECPSCGKRASRRTLYCPFCGEEMQASNPEEIRRRRFLPLGKTTDALVREYLERRSAKSDKLIPLSRQMVDKIIKEAAEDTGLGGNILSNPEGNGKPHQVSAQKLREAHCMYCFLKMPTLKRLKALQQQLGYVNFGTTMRYLKLDPNRSKEIYDNLFSDE